MPSEQPDAAVVERMRREWDERARENARHYVATGRTDWNDLDYFESGRMNIREQILNDMTNICQGMDPKDMTVLEIGCGSGRITRALAEMFGAVYAVDISGEMVRQAKESVQPFPHAQVFQNNGSDLTVLGDIRIDFAYSFIVFQHIPSRAVIYNYVREVHRLLKPGGLFKFQIQGDPKMQGEDSWLGVGFSEAEAQQMADECGFEARYMHGAGTQYFWVWFFKKPLV